VGFLLFSPPSSLLCKSAVCLERGTWFGIQAQFLSYAFSRTESEQFATAGGKKEHPWHGYARMLPELEERLKNNGLS